MASELLLPTARAADTDNAPYSGAKWYFYVKGTSTAHEVYSDPELTVSLGSVVTADSGGKFPPIYMDAGQLLRGVCKSSDGAVTLHDIDQLNTGLAADVAEANAAAELAIAGVNSESHYYAATLAAAITAGLAATTNGQYFRATGDDVDYIGVYLDNAGVAEEKGRYATSDGIASASEYAAANFVRVYDILLDLVADPTPGAINLTESIEAAGVAERFFVSVAEGTGTATVSLLIGGVAVVSGQVVTAGVDLSVTLDEDVAEGDDITFLVTAYDSTVTALFAKAEVRGVDPTTPYLSLQVSANLDDVADAATARDNLGAASAPIFCYQLADRVLTNDTSLQKIFDQTANGAVTLPLGMYRFRLMLEVSGMSATSGNALLSLLGAGTAVLVGNIFQAVGIDATTPATVATQTGAFIRDANATGASAVVAATGTAFAVDWAGLFRVSTAGTLIPSIQLVTASAATVEANSHIIIERIAATGVYASAEFS